MENYASPYQENLLDEEVYLVQADTGKRFANWLIDIIFFYFCVFIFLFVKTLITHRPPVEGDASGFGLRVLSVICFLIFNSVIETLSGGKSLGKLITRTRAVNDDGSRLDGGSAFLRSLCRIVPFEPLSAFGNPPYPWHDKWSHTYVIDEKLSRLP